MKLSETEAKLFFRRAQRHFKVTNVFIKQNITDMLKFIQYAITPRIILKRKIIRKRNRVFVLHNYLRKLIFDPRTIKKRRRAKRLLSQWSKRLVLYLRRSSIIEYVEEEVEREGRSTTTTEALSTKDVSEQLKEQLELLKSGKRTVPLLEDMNNFKQTENVEKFSKDICTAESCLLQTEHSDKDDKEKYSTSTEVPLLTAVHISVEEFKASQNKTSEKCSESFLDMLISKVKHTSDVIGITDTLLGNDFSMEPPKVTNKISEKEVIELDEHENSNSSSDFFGFEDSERVLGNFPGMLSTPIVRKRNSNSVFVSETLNAYMRDNSLESSKAVNYPQRTQEDGQVMAKSIPPKLDMPSLPEGLQGLRTVAERRAFLQRTKNTKYCIINNILTIFRELQKRCKGHRIYKQSIESVINSTSVPMTRQGWKAAAWLLTDVGNYYYQKISIDGEDFRLCGGRGNFRDKFKKPYSSFCEKLVSICPANCVDRAIFRSLRPIRTPEKRSKLNDESKRKLYKPCPLSQKIIHSSYDEESVFGSLDIVRMPSVELEVFPQLQRPLSEIAKKYLRLILPYDKISREWAEFSVSTLFETQHRDFKTESLKSFTFKIPYANDRNHLIIRRLYKRSEDFENQANDLNFSFRKEIDQKNMKDEAPDQLSVECADILTDMINSVAIACSENSFIKDDPDNIYQYNQSEDEEMTENKSFRKIDQQPQQPGIMNKKQTRLLNELKRLNATVIDAATVKSNEDGTACYKESCKLGCVCPSLKEGSIVRQHCGKQKCVLECKCKNPSVLRLATDGCKITTEDAFMLRRQATAKLARVEKEFTSTIVLTGNETLLINESQYDKKRRCTKIPKRYGDYVDQDDADSIDSKQSTGKRKEISSTLPLEPVLVNDKIHNNLKHCSIRLKKIASITDLAPWCMIHMVYNCFCKGHITFGNPILIEKLGEREIATADETPVLKSRSLYSFDKEECKKNLETYSTADSDIYETSEISEVSETVSEFMLETEEKKEENKIEKRGRIPDNHYIEIYMNAKANHCRRVVPIPKNIYKRKNKKRMAHIQLYIAENENDETRLSLNEHVLRSVYYHKDISEEKRKCIPQLKEEEQVKLKTEKISPLSKDLERKSTQNEIHIKDKKLYNQEDVPIKVRRLSMEESNSSSLLLEHHNKGDMEQKPSNFGSLIATKTSPKFVPSHDEQIKVPKISQIFSLNTGVMELETETSSRVSLEVPVAVTGTSVLGIAPAKATQKEASLESATIPTRTEQPSVIDITQEQSEMALGQGTTSDAFKNVFKQVIKNMNNLVSKKMQDIDMALRRESKAIPAPNAEILCIIKWNNFLDAYLEGFVYLWEVQTTSVTFIAATIKPIMPLVINALSVVNIQAIFRDKLPLLGRMLSDKKRSANSDGLAVVMQGQKMYWIVKGFLRPDKTRICPKPTPESHPLLTKKINVLCRLLINNQFNEHKKRQNAQQAHISLESPQRTINSTHDLTEEPTTKTSMSNRDSNTLELKHPIASSSLTHPPAHSVQNNISLKLKVLPMQRNISDQATSILEQMVSQAYGFVRTNLTFRKIRQNEFEEIFPPAKINSNHHWLVLDISNDFSHIFVPELKDLLTLDRIQKVMAYALTKNRIVKMQFSQKSLFNAYVTPKSQKKLYFGPYRSRTTTPKLVLLQSVDGQMMLREVYESRHNIMPKSSSTTAFWVVQKNGKVYLDVEKEKDHQLNEQKLDKTNCISLLNEKISKNQSESDSSAQFNFISTVSKKLNDPLQTQQNVETFQNMHIQQFSQIEQSNKFGEAGKTVLKNENLLNIALKKSLIEDQKASCSSVEKTKSENRSKYIDDDDDCMIVDDEVCINSKVDTTAISQIPAVNSSNDSISLPCGDCQISNAARINYTISYGGESSSLMVIQNENNQSPLVSNTFTVLPDKQQTSLKLFESQDNDLLKNSQKTIPVNTNLKLSAVENLSFNSKTVNEKIKPGGFFIKFPNNNSTYNFPISSEQLPKYPNSPSMKINESPISNPIEIVSQTGNENETSLDESKSMELDKVPLILNKNITIKKIITEVEQTRSTPYTYSRKSLPINATQKNILPKQEKLVAYSRPPQIKMIEQTNIVKNQVFRHQVKPTTNSTANQQYIQPRLEGGIKVCAPTTINTLISQQQQYSNRNSTGCMPKLKTANNTISCGMRLQVPNAKKVPALLIPGTSKNEEPFLNCNTNSTKIAPENIINKTLPGFNPTQQKDVLKQTFNISQQSSLKNSRNQCINTVKTYSPKMLQCESLKPAEGSTMTITNSVSQSKLPNKPSFANNLHGIKRNSLGSPLNRPQFRLKPCQNLKIGERSSLSVKQDIEIKGIPIELPRLKKFAIVSSPTQKSMSLKPDSCCKTNAETPNSNPTTSDEPVSKKLFTTLIKKPSPHHTTSTKTIKTNTSNSLNANAEYGYFHANLDGLPKFVVKRVGDDFLIKVPNFNGILKLTGLSTVYNYLNQYTTQKCGKTNEEIANLKWSFKVQDRSKLNIINKSDASMTRVGVNFPNVQKISHSTEQTSTASTIGKAQLQSVIRKQLKPSDSIDLSED